MPAPPARVDPFPASRFVVEIDRMPAAFFAEVSGLGSEVTVLEFRALDEQTPRKLPGLRKYSNIVLKRGVTQDAALWNWHESLDRRDGAVVLLDAKGKEVVRWRFHRGWPCKWIGPVLRAGSDDVAIETFEIAVEGIELAR